MLLDVGPASDHDPGRGLPLLPLPSRRMPGNTEGHGGPEIGLNSGLRHQGSGPAMFLSLEALGPRLASPHTCLTPV